MQEGYLSYPRTETDQFPEGFDTRSLIEMQTPHHLWGEYASRLLNGDIYQCAPFIYLFISVHPCCQPRAHRSFVVATRRTQPHGRWAHRHPRGGGHDDHAHPPIHPVKAATAQVRCVDGTSWGSLRSVRAQALDVDICG